MEFGSIAKACSSLMITGTGEAVLTVRAKQVPTVQVGTRGEAYDWG